MPRVFSPPYILRIVFALLAMLGGPLAGEVPLVFSPSQLDLGTLQAHQKVSRQVTLENRGEQTIRILATRTDCGCTVAQPSLDVLAKGESTQLQVEFDAQNMTGQLYREIRVVTDKGTVTLPLRVFVNPFGEWVSETTSVVFELSDSGESQTQTLQFTHPAKEGEESPRLLTAWSPADWLEATVLNSGIPGQFAIQVTRKANAPVGTLQTFLKVHTNTAGGEFSIPVLARIRGKLAIYPNPITMGTGTVGQPRRKAVTIEGWDATLAPPSLLLPQGSAQYNGMRDGRLNYILTVIPEQAGILQVTLLVCDPDVSQADITQNTTVHAEVPVIMRALAP